MTACAKLIAYGSKHPSEIRVDAQDAIIPAICGGSLFVSDGGPGGGTPIEFGASLLRDEQTQNQVGTNERRLTFYFGPEDDLPTLTDIEDAETTPSTDSLPALVTGIDIVIKGIDAHGIDEALKDVAIPSLQLSSISVTRA
jgi:hypothetical protein